MRYGSPMRMFMPNFVPSVSGWGSPTALFTESEPSKSACRVASARTAKMASGGAAMTRLTDTCRSGMG